MITDVLHEFILFPLNLKSCLIIKEFFNLVAKKRKHQHILKTARALLFSSFWCEAIHTVVYLINKRATPVLNNISPFESPLHPPPHSYLHAFGCLCFVHLPSLEKHKLFHQAATCFLGFSDEHKGPFGNLLLK